MKEIVIPLLIMVLILSGCTESFVKEIRYEKVPTSFHYVIRYGYKINSTGNGRFNVTYFCMTPNPISGEIKYLKILGENYRHREISYGENRILRWSFEERGSKRIVIGIEADIESGYYMVDLNKRESPNITDINSDLKNRYCRSQSIGEKTVIDPYNNMIKNIAYSVKRSDNAFEVAEELFRWLKKNTRYEYHNNTALPQSDTETLDLNSGDCDDLSILYISLCRSVGIPARLVRGYILEDNNGIFIPVPHAWTEVYVGFGRDGWIPVECAGISNDVKSEVDQNFGVEDAFHLRLFVDNGTNSSLTLSTQGVKAWYNSGIRLDIEPFVEISDIDAKEYRSLIVKENGERFYQ